jgi:hypothetical protein
MRKTLFTLLVAICLPENSYSAFQAAAIGEHIQNLRELLEDSNLTAAEHK